LIYYDRVFMGKKEKIQGGIEFKLDNLKKMLSDLGRVAVAFSGGVDSTLLLKVAKEVLGDNAIGIYSDSPLQAARERKEVFSLAGLIGVELIVFKVDKLNHEAFRDNPVNRCYLCKGLIFDEILSFAHSRGFNILVDGSNFDDLKDYRPGAKALKERAVKSPLQEAELTKQEIRIISKYYGLPTWDKDALACLATRIPTGEVVNEKKLGMIDRAEEILVNKGFRNVRARHLGDTVKLEVKADQVSRLSSKSIFKEIVARMKEVGFAHVTINPEGYIQGSMTTS
jgi:pyridinium-3,5-biscarboxylic acid mononucleotide sulfurtransferase